MVENNTSWSIKFNYSDYSLYWALLVKRGKFMRFFIRENDIFANQFMTRANQYAWAEQKCLLIMRLTSIIHPFRD
jgi:hypothetical protein